MTRRPAVVAFDVIGTLMSLEPLRELDDRALSDIGIARSQIEAAVHGLTPTAERGRLS